MLVKTALIRYNLVVGFKGKTLEQLKEMVLYSIVLQLIPVCNANIFFGEVAFIWYCVPNAPSHLWRSRIYMVLRTKCSFPPMEKSHLHGTAYQMLLPTYGEVA